MKIEAIHDLGDRLIAELRADYPSGASITSGNAQALCDRDGGRLWGVSICAPMVIGDARTQTCAASQPPPDAPP